LDPEKDVDGDTVSFAWEDEKWLFGRGSKVDLKLELW
jgi:hypothetical protein